MLPALTLHFDVRQSRRWQKHDPSVVAHDHGAILISEDIGLMRLFGDQMKIFDDYVRFSKHGEV